MPGCEVLKERNREERPCLFTFDTAKALNLYLTILVQWKIRREVDLGRPSPLSGCSPRVRGTLSWGWQGGVEEQHTSTDPPAPLCAGLALAGPHCPADMGQWKSRQGRRLKRVTISRHSGNAKHGDLQGVHTALLPHGTEQGWGCLTWQCAHALLLHLLHKLCPARSTIINPGSPSTLVTGDCKPCDGCHKCSVQPSGMGMLIHADSSQARTNTTSWAPGPAHRFVCTVELCCGVRALAPVVR